MSSTQQFIKQIIIDNIKPNTDILNITRNILKDKLKDIRQLNKGGLIITPSDATHIAYIANVNTYPTDNYGDKLYIHITTENTDTTDKHPWLCINQVPFDKPNEQQTLTDIYNTITNTTDINGNYIQIYGLHRKLKGPLATSLMLFKTTTQDATDYLLNNNIPHMQRTLTTRLHINKTQIQCTRCHKLGHTHKHCINTYTCVRCGEDCPPQNCKNNYKKCTNCHGPHSSTYANCQILKQHIQKRFHHNMTITYAQTLNNKQQSLNTTQIHQQNEITKLNDLHNTVQTLQNTLTDLHTKQQQHQQQLDKLNETVTKQQQQHQQQLDTLNETVTKQQQHQQQQFDKLTEIVTKQQQHHKQQTEKLDKLAGFTNQELSKLFETTTKQQQTQDLHSEQLNKLNENITTQQNTQDLQHKRQQAQRLRIETINQKIDKLDNHTISVKATFKEIERHMNKHVELFSKINTNHRATTTKINEIITYNLTLTTDITLMDLTDLLSDDDVSTNHTSDENEDEKLPTS